MGHFNSTWDSILFFKEESEHIDLEQHMNESVNKNRINEH